MDSLVERLPIAGDKTAAVALEMAERHLIKLGWKHTPEEIGQRAARIISAMEDDVNTRRAALSQKEG